MPSLPINTFILLLAHPILNIALNQVRKKGSEASEKPKAMAATGSGSSPNFLIVNPNKGRKRDIFKYLVGNNTKSGMNFLDSSEERVKENQKRNTQVFVFTDKPKDANLIVISFRGTEPFNAQDWSTDFDFSWYEVPKVGKLHIGFLEAMGLGSRRDATTFQSHLQRKHTSFFHLNGESEGSIMEMAKKSAYYAVSMKLKDLMKQHKNAKFVVTGHSLGGALAILFPCVLVIQEESEMIHRLLNIYTFGQPRIGDVQLGTFMEAHLNYPVNRYYRVVYCCNDMVPRVPFDDKIFAFKHFGVCLYYDSRYFGRGMGLVLPGVSAHSPIDYVNSVRLGKERTFPLSTLKSFARKV
ncbi:hypothetical protein GH714_017982 [Hevea brasiliensis]|uniref:Fungal lipase-type domain-containing protein n=1 Tax=Hevea brasiliensis TaxID=3981 RepID=A0A6A6LMN8_HEVBR|nr:hypothetical protein GH714_017982 [Hevea brasiliensis]